MVRPRAVIFDMDGLLLDSEPVWHEAEAELARAWGAPWTEADAAGCTGKGIPQTAEKIAAAAGRPFDAAGDPALLVERFLALSDRVRPKRGGPSLVARLVGAGVPLALGSASPRRVIERLLTNTGLRPSFSIIVSADDVTRVKPEPDIFLGCAARLGVAPADCLVLEDSLAGVTAGRRAGMHVFAVPERLVAGAGARSPERLVAGAGARSPERLVAGAGARSPERVDAAFFEIADAVFESLDHASDAIELG